VSCLSCLDTIRFHRASSTVNLSRAPCNLYGLTAAYELRPRGIAGSLIALQTQINAAGRRRSVKFRVELVWTDNEENDASSIFLTSDGRVVLQGRAISPLERQALALPADGEMISVDRNLIRAIKDML
jgi:hypothetical protein